MCSTKADKVVIENGRAVGVQVVPTKFLSSGQPESKIVRARKQIIVSCGTLSSPLVLQRSGIGIASSANHPKTAPGTDRQSQATLRSSRPSASSPRSTYPVSA